jgi:hypothetical protein
MRPERITQKRAQEIYDNIRANIKLAPIHGTATELPPIDMADVFAGKLSLTWRKVVQHVCSVVDGIVPSEQG